jgi:hypothetical protein
MVQARRPFRPVPHARRTLRARRREVSKTGVVAAAPVLDESVGCESPLQSGGAFGDCYVLRYPECKFIKRWANGVACPRPGCKARSSSRNHGVAAHSTAAQSTQPARWFSGTNRWNRALSARHLSCEKYYAKNLTVKYCQNEGCGYRNVQAMCRRKKQSRAES